MECENEDDDVSSKTDKECSKEKITRKAKKQNRADNPKKKRKFKGKKQPKCIRVNVNQAYYPLVREVIEGMGNKITDDESNAHLIWINANGSSEIASELQPWQFYNHFPGMVALSRKIDLAQSISKMEQMMPHEYSFHPKTYILPLQHAELAGALDAEGEPFIVKPDKGSLGRGIFIALTAADIDGYSDAAVAQRYIDPLLIDGLKFDLRIYVLVTSIDPLRIYVHDEGMARFCTEAYAKPTAQNVGESFRHLTNYAVNKKNGAFAENAVDAGTREETGHKRSLSAVLTSAAAMGHDPAEIRAAIDEVIRLTIVSGQAAVAAEYRVGIRSNDGKSRCFEILGFDIMLDSAGKPWLLEVNNKPSMAAESGFDRELKSSVIRGALQIVDIRADFKTAIAERLKQRSTLGRGFEGGLFDAAAEERLAGGTGYRLLFPLPPGAQSAADRAMELAGRRTQRPNPPPGPLPVANPRAHRPEPRSVRNSQPIPDSPPRLARPAMTPPRKAHPPAAAVTVLEAPRPHAGSRLRQRSGSVHIGGVAAKSVPRRIPFRAAPPEAPLITEMMSLPPNPVLREEERARIMDIRRQAAAGARIALWPAVQRAFCAISPSPPSFAVQPGLPSIARQFTRASAPAFPVQLMARDSALPQL